MSSPVPVAHVCTLEHSYQDGNLWQCSCGTFWAPVRGKLLNIRTVNPRLLRRLDEHRQSIGWGDYSDLADAVRHAAVRDRAQREIQRDLARMRWARLQAAKRAKGRRIVREMILSRPCAYCGGEAEHVDHVVPVTLGGTDAMRNLAAACAPCNIEKSDRTPDEWKAWRLNRGRSWPPVH
jgi:5-methylcytosine-specific restriction endonuclease McrA